MLKRSDLNSPDEASVSADADKLPSIANNQKYSGVNKTALEVKKRLAEKSKNIGVTVDQIKVEKLISTEIRILNADFKDDIMSMEAPVFSLSKDPEKNLHEWTWVSIDGKKSITVIPSIKGRPTIYDKDILIYIYSCLVQRINDGLPISKTVKFHVYDYLKAIKSDVGGYEYKRFGDALDRLKGNTIKTDIKSNNIEIVSSFSLIESYRLEKVGKKIEFAEVTLSDWLFNAVEGLNMLSISPDYFSLKKPLERRLYEIARKHVGNQADFKIRTEYLLSKGGSVGSIKEFKRILREIIKIDSTPDYRLRIVGEFTQIYQKDQKKYVAALANRASKQAVRKNKL